MAAQGDESVAVATVAGVVSFHGKVIEGMSVSKGTPLVVLSSKNMADGDPVQRARIAYETARKEYERMKELLPNKIVSEKYYPYLRTIGSANFRTPYNNKVYTLKDLNGRLLSYGKASGDNGYYVPVTFEFDNKGDVIPGSFVEIFLLSSPMENVISLPHTALTEEQGSFFVYLQVDEEGYKKQLVTLGADNGEKVQILSGVKAGDKVVTQGAYQVKLAGATNAIPAHSHEH